MHELSVGTWFIHIATLLEWSLAIVMISYYSRTTRNTYLNWLAIAMLPNLTSAMAAITWHIFDNSIELKGLVVFQAALTMLGNTCMAIAAFIILKKESKLTE
tara:strand:+ start:3955 stop:4260 length:306 start_codon:yes stop_codon:yes gene_type:complete